LNKEQYYAKEKEGIYKSFIRPHTPEQPLICVRKETDAEDFKALFALELAGVTWKEDNQKTSNKSNEEEKVDMEQHRNLLLSGISSEQRIDFIYNSRKIEQGNSCFTLKIFGTSEGNTSEEAVNKALSLWQNLSVLLGQ